MGNPRSKKESIKKVDLNNEVERLMTPEIRKELGISPAFQKFLISYLDLRDSQIVKNLKEQLPVDAKICDNIADKVYDKLAETIAPMLIKFEDLTDGQISIAKSISDLKNDTEHIKVNVKDIEKNYQTLNGKIIQLKQNIPEKMESQLKGLQTDLSKMMKRNTWGSIIFRLAITAIITILLAFTLLPYFHSHILENKDGTPKTEILKK